MNYWCCEADFGEHTKACERASRITRLIEERFMTPLAAATVVDAAMFGIGCLEGEVRAKIQAEQEKQKP